MLKKYRGEIGVVVTLLAGELAIGDAAEVGGSRPAAPATAPAAAPMPYLLKPEGQQFTLLKNWTFGNQRPDATVRNKTELDQDFYYRYIWENGKLDKFSTYWSYH